MRCRALQSDDEKETEGGGGVPFKHASRRTKRMKAKTNANICVRFRGNLRRFVSQQFIPGLHPSPCFRVGWGGSQAWSLSCARTPRRPSENYDPSTVMGFMRAGERTGNKRLSPEHLRNVREDPRSPPKRRSSLSILCFYPPLI